MAPPKGFTPHNKIEIDLELMKKLYYESEWDYLKIAKHFGFKSKSAIYDRFKLLGLRARNNTDLKTGTKHSLATRKKISAGLMGRKMSDENREKISKRVSGRGNPMYGKYAEESPNWKGGWLSKCGYRKVNFMGHQQLEHRVIWMLHHKRDIPNGYVIHHIDFNKSNNEIKNLKLMKEKDHLKLHTPERDSIGRFKSRVSKA